MKASARTGGGQIWRVRLYWWTERAISRVFEALQTVHQGFWLGFLDRETFREVDRQSYLTWNKLYRDRQYNLSGLWAWESNSIDRYFVECRSVLVGAAGGGREIVALSKRGFRVDAFDCSKDLLDGCRELLNDEKIQARLFLSRPDEIPSGLEIYDGLIVGWGAYMHIAGRESRISFLRALRRHVRPGGPILLSFMTRKSNSRKARRIVRIARTIRRLRGSADGIELGDALISSFNHLFTRNEIRMELQEADFNLDNYAEQPYGHAVGLAVEDNDQTNQQRPLALV